MATRTRNLNVAVTADTKSFQKGIKDADRSLDKFSRSAQTRSKVTAGAMKGLGVAAVGATAGVVGLAAVGKKLVDAYAESEKSQARLQAQLKASGISFGAHRKEIDKVITSTSRLAAVDDEDLQDAFTSLVRSTGKVGQSMKDMTLVTDLARAKNLDLTKAADLIGKVHAGNTGVLKRYGITLDPVTTAQDKLKASTKNATDEQVKAAKATDTAATSTKAIGELQKRFAGQAAAYGKTNAGSIDRFKVAVQNLEETAGGALAPTLTKVATKASKFVEEMQDGTGAGGRFVDKLKDIRDTITPIADKLISGGKAVAKFADKHPEVTKLAGATIAVGLALKGIKFTSSATGFTDLLKAGKSAMTGLKKVLARGGQAAGEAAAANAAEGMANQMPTSLNARKGKFAAAGRGVGAVLGTAVGVAAVAGIGLALTGYLTKLNDQLEKKGGIAGLLGKISNIGEDLANLTPQTRGIVGAAKALTGQGARKAGGGRIPGAPVAADTVPALLSPQEFVVTGDGERTLEGMTFPGVLDWLQGAQAPHFAGGGRARRKMAGGGRVGTAIAAARKAGFSGTDLVNMIAIAGRESGYIPTKHNPVPPDDSWGLWQINVRPEANPRFKSWNLTDPYVNARAARILFKAGGLSPWNHKGGPLGGTDVAAARRAVLGAGTGGSSSGGTGSVTLDRATSFLGAQYGTGYEAGLSGSSIHPVLDTVLGYVGQATRSAASGVKASAASVRLGAAGKLQLPTTFKSTHQTSGLSGYPAIDVFASPGTTVGSPIDGTVARFSGRPPSAGAYQGQGGPFGYSMYVDGNGKSYFLTHFGSRSVKVGERVSRGQVLGTVGDYPGGTPDHIHEGLKGMRRGGRLARMARRFGGGGRGGFNAARRKPSDYPGGSGGSGRKGSQIAGLLRQLSHANTNEANTLLKRAQPILAAKGSFGSLRAWINAANRYGEGKGVTAAGHRGLTAFVALAQAEYGRQLGRDVAGVDAAEGGFDQASTDLGNQLVTAGATDADVAGRQGALATSQLQQLYVDQKTLQARLQRARKTGDKGLVATLSARVAQNQSDIYAKQAAVVGYGNDLRSAQAAGADSTDTLQQSIDDLAAAMKAHTDMLQSVRDSIDTQTKTAVAFQENGLSQALKFMADWSSGYIGAGAVAANRSAGNYTVAAY